MFTYVCFYRGKQITVQALRSFDAQEKAAKLFKARKRYEVAVVLAGRPQDTTPTNTVSLAELVAAWDEGEK